MCGWQKVKDPQIDPMADAAIAQGGIGGLESLVYICSYHSYADFQSLQKKYHGSNFETSERIIS